MGEWLLVLSLVRASWKAEPTTEKESGTFMGTFNKAFSELWANLHIMAAIILPKNISDLVSYFSHEFIRVRISTIMITLEVKYQTFQKIVPSLWVKH